MAAPDFSSLISAVDFSTADTALLTVFAALVVIGAVWYGGRLIVDKVFGNGMEFRDLDYEDHKRDQNW